MAKSQVFRAHDMTKLERQRLADIKSLARSLHTEAWDLIGRIMRNEDEDTKYRLRCAELVIERVEGRARQNVVVSQDKPATASELRLMADRLELAEKDPFIKEIIDARFMPALPEGSGSASDPGVDA